MFILSVASPRNFYTNNVLQQTDLSVCFLFNDHNFTPSKLIILVSTLA
jgi:hypothetical protein